MKDIEKYSALFVLALLIHDPLITIFRFSFLAHFFLGIALIYYIFVFVFEFTKSGKIYWYGGLISFLFISPFVIIGFLYSILDKGDLIIKFQFLFTFLLIPFIWTSIGHIRCSSNFQKKIILFICIYIYLEFFIILGQISYLVLGIGFPINNSFYEGMIVGSQFNSNNLAVIVSIYGLFLLNFRNYFNKISFIILQSVIYFILLVTFSRMALIIYTLTLVFFHYKISTKKILSYFLIIYFYLSVIINLNVTGNDTIDNLIYKTKSLFLIFTIGFQTDSSTLGRSQSYIAFFENISELGIGSVAIFDYSKYTYSEFSDSLLGTNPHSLLIETGYWLGWSGLFSFLLFVVYVYFINPNKSLIYRLWLIFSFFMLSSIPSSVIPLPTVWLGFLLLSMISDNKTKHKII